MAKRYELIGCIYDKYAKKKYQEEEVIKLDGVAFSSLEDIDRFTCQLSYIDFLKCLPECYQGKNLFSIRVWHHKNDTCYYLKTIFDDPSLVAVLDRIEKKNIYPAGQIRSIHSVPYDEDIVYDTFEPIKRALLEKDGEKLKTLIKTSPDYLWKLERFTMASYDEKAESDELRQLREEFCHYPIFRSAYIGKMREKTSSSNIKIYKTPVGNQVLKKVYIFDQMYPDYENKVIHSINTRSEKEEFLDFAEIESAYDPFFEPKGKEKVNRHA